MKPYCILTDSACDLSDQQAAQYDIKILRMPIVVDGHEYIDGVDIDIDQVKNYLRNDIPVHTSQATLGSLVAMYEKLLKEYQTIVHIPLSGGLSGMYQTACAQAKNYGGRVIVINAKCMCYPLAQLCIDIKHLLDMGIDPLTIKDKIEEHHSLMEAIIIPSDLKYLKMGGRITATAAALASLLRITAVLSLKDGIIDLYDKAKTLKKAIQKGLEPILNVEDPQAYYWMVIADECADQAQKVSLKMQEATGEEVSSYAFGTVVLSHTGPGTLAFGRLRKVKQLF